MPWCDFDLTFDLDIVTLSYNILSGSYLCNRKVLEVDSWKRKCLGVVGVQHYGVILI